MATLITAIAVLVAVLVLTKAGREIDAATQRFMLYYAGVLALPDLVPKDKALGDALRLVHVALNSLLAVVVCVHVAAALKHHFVDRDDSLIRMLPSSWFNRVVRS